jgi:dTDP-4-amino-4,6-dideoxygalactose transaminase
VIEDAAQAHGARYKGRPAGSMGRIACFSFYPGKNLGAYGEGGAIVTDREDLAERARMLRDHGQRQRYIHELVGYNYRMDGLQGAVLTVKLRHLEEWTAGRNRVASRYHEGLAGSGVVRPAPCPDGRHAYHLYVVRHPQRDALRDRLQRAGIQTGLHYPIPVHLQVPYRPLGYREGSLPVSEEIARTCLSLPMYPELTDDQISCVVQTLCREAPPR